MRECPAFCSINGIHGAHTTGDAPDNAALIVEAPVEFSLLYLLKYCTIQFVNGVSPNTCDGKPVEDSEDACTCLFSDL